MHEPVFNFTCRKVGVIYFISLGRFRFSFCVASRRREHEGGRTVEVSHDA